jgi:hypothetical protein
MLKTSCGWLFTLETRVGKCVEGCFDNFCRAGLYVEEEDAGGVCGYTMSKKSGRCGPYIKEVGASDLEREPVVILERVLHEQDDLVVRPEVFAHSVADHIVCPSTIARGIIMTVCS